MMHTFSLRNLDKDNLLRDFSALIEKDRRDTATPLVYIAEISPKPDVPSSIRALPTAKGEAQPSIDTDRQPDSGAESNNPVRTFVKQTSRPIPLAPRRYKLQVTIGEETRHKLDELQALLSHQIPDGDPAKLLDRALDALLAETKKRKAALTDRPRRSQKKSRSKTRAIPAKARREVFNRDEGRCAFVDADGRRCSSQWQVEFHHRLPYARGGTHDTDNIELRCRAHNQYEADLEYGALFMETRRHSRSNHEQSG